MITLHSLDQSSLVEIDIIGASITRLQLRGQEILWSGTRPDNGKGITHPCIPNFNIATGLPNHGPARKEEWKQVDEKTFSWSMQPIDDLYPAGIESTRVFELRDDKFLVTTTIHNTSNKDLPINIAEHNYFACEPSQRSSVKINGISFDAGGLEANAKYLPIIGSELRIEIPERPTILMTVEGYAAFAQWSQPDAPFVCVEPIQVLPLEPDAFMTQAPKLKAGEKKVFRYEITVNS